MLIVATTHDRQPEELGEQNEIHIQTNLPLANNQTGTASHQVDSVPSDAPNSRCGTIARGFAFKSNAGAGGQGN
jgi:hypothetical protein